MEEQSAVEWLIDYLKNTKELPFIRQNLNINEQNILNDIIEQAKEMEKANKEDLFTLEQVIEAMYLYRRNDNPMSEILAKVKFKGEL